MIWLILRTLGGFNKNTEVILSRPISITRWYYLRLTIGKGEIGHRVTSNRHSVNELDSITTGSDILLQIQISYSQWDILYFFIATPAWKSIALYQFIKDNFKNFKFQISKFKKVKFNNTSPFLLFDNGVFNFGFTVFQLYITFISSFFSIFFL